VMVVSFMIAVPFSLGAPSWAASHPCYEHLCPDPTPPPGFFRGLSGTPVVSDPTARRFRVVMADPEGNEFCASPLADRTGGGAANDARATRFPAPGGCCAVVASGS
jgi:hypothetical protein